MIQPTIPNARTPLLDRLGGLCSRDWYSALSRLFSAAPQAYRPVDSGVATLVAGTVTVNSIYAASANPVHLTRQTTGGTPGHLSIGTVTAGKTFVINSSSATETSTVFWTIFAPIT